jgi:short-subunit dehydrogenase
MSTPVWFITGCSSGFGNELAKYLLEVLHYNVVVTSRKIIDVAHFASNPNALVAEVDVTAQDQINTAVNAAIARFGQIDVLVNNAGYGYFGALEESEEEEVKKMYDVNVFGMARMTNAVLPGMRGRRSGAIINIASLAGICGCPGAGHYSGTKFAVDGMSDALAQEVKPLGIKVMVVQPSQFRTNWADKSITSNNRISDYDETAKAKADQLKGNAGKQAGDPVRAVKAIVKAIEANNTPLHLLLGSASHHMATQKLESLKKEYSDWEILSRSVDFPKA